ncbi:MAG: SIR2 family protein [Candidatus Saccharimonas sp.]|nr:SIR2 family protein [Planctomycetaceae bacterium]
MNYIPDNTIDRIKRRGMVLFYGAGMTCSVGIPSWQELLEKLASDLSYEPGLVAKLSQQGYSLPRIASYLFLASKQNRTCFNSTVRQGLYAKEPLKQFFDKKLKDFPNGARDFVSLIESQNPNLAGLAKLLVVPRYDGSLTTNPTHAPNPSVAAVITTNYDDLLRSYIWEKYVVQQQPASAETRRLLRTVDRPSATPRHGMINLYHVHGFLQLKRYDKDSDREASLGGIVLTETDYFNEFSSRSMYFPSILHQKMSHHVSVFVGMSMTDQNINRILYQVRQDCATESQRRLGRHIALLLKSGQEIQNEVVNKLLEELGVKPIWYSDHAEVSEILKELYIRTFHPCTGLDANSAWGA